MPEKEIFDERLETMVKSGHTPDPWIDSPGAPDAIIAPDARRPPVEIFPDNAFEHYGGVVIAESVSPCDKPLIKTAPKMFDAIWSLVYFLSCKEADEPLTIVETSVVRVFNQILIEACGGVIITQSMPISPIDRLLIRNALELFEALRDICEAFEGEDGMDRAMRAGFDGELFAARVALANVTEP